mmetsp:Transcript_59196/g.163728  ORF Transcript_59196/g.163728 Transcript_59196/m.163728 type:complete len:333 (-) Transcript_59196:163-1161(-)
MRLPHLLREVCQRIRCQRRRHRPALVFPRFHKRAPEACAHQRSRVFGALVEPDHRPGCIDPSQLPNLGLRQALGKTLPQRARPRGPRVRPVLGSSNGVSHQPQRRLRHQPLLRRGEHVEHAQAGQYTSRTIVVQKSPPNAVQVGVLWRGLPAVFQAATFWHIKVLGHLVPAQPIKATTDQKFASSVSKPAVLRTRCGTQELEAKFHEFFVSWDCQPHKLVAWLDALVQSANSDKPACSRFRQRDALGRTLLNVNKKLLLDMFDKLCKWCEGGSPASVRILFKSSGSGGKLCRGFSEGWVAARRSPWRKLDCRRNVCKRWKDNFDRYGRGSLL